MAENSSIKKYLSLDRLKEYDAKIKAKIEAGDAALQTYIDGQIDDVYTELTSVNTNIGLRIDDIDEAIEGINNEVSGVGSSVNELYNYIGGDGVIQTTDYPDVMAYIDAKCASNAEAVDDTRDLLDAISGKIGTVPENSTVMGIIGNIGDIPKDNDNNPIADTVIDYIDVTNTNLDGVAAKVDTLIGSDADANKSVRAIAAEELAAQLIDENATESLNTLEEIAAWIQSHPEDAAAMNEAIGKLQGKTLLGKYDDNGETKEYATVKDYVEAVAEEINASLASVETGFINDVKVNGTSLPWTDQSVDITVPTGALADKDVVSASDLDTALATRISTLEAAIGESGSVAGDIATAKAEAIAAAAEDASNKDVVVLAEAQKAISAVQKGFDASINALGTAAYASTDDFDAFGSAAAAEANANGYTDAAIANFTEITTAEINELFSENSENPSN